MPRNVRNFWLQGRIDGSSTRIAAGPQAKDGGFDLVIYQRENGEVSEGLSIIGRALGDGTLVVTVLDGHDELARLTTSRGEAGRKVTTNGGPLLQLEPMTRGTVRQLVDPSRVTVTGDDMVTGMQDGSRVFFYQSPDLAALWHGGEYIDLYPAGTSSHAALSGDVAPFDCFNVWDHATDAPTIERTAQAFRTYMDDRMRTARVVTTGYPGEIWVEDE